MIRSKTFDVCSTNDVVGSAIPGLENMVIDILRTKYPTSSSVSLDLYYNSKGHRFHDFSILLKNLEKKKKEFIPDEQIISKFISLAKPFRESANQNAHSIIAIENGEKVKDYKIPEMIALLMRLIRA